MTEKKDIPIPAKNIIDDNDLANLENILNGKNKRKKRKNEENLNKNKLLNNDINSNLPLNDKRNDEISPIKNNFDKSQKDNYEYNNINVGDYNMKYAANNNNNNSTNNNIDLYNIPIKLDKHLQEENKNEDLQFNKYFDNKNNDLQFNDRKSSIKSDAENQQNITSRRTKREKDFEDEIEKQFSIQEKQNNLNNKQYKEENIDFSHVHINDDTNYDNENLLNDSFNRIRSNRKLRFDLDYNLTEGEKHINSNDENQTINNNTLNNNFQNNYNEEGQRRNREIQKKIDEENNKREYYELKLAEFKRYEESIRKNYETQKKNFKSKRRSAEEEFRNSINKELEEYKIKKQSDLKEFLKNEEEKLALKNKENLKDFEKSYKLSSMTEEEELSVHSLKLENKISELEITKNKLNKEYENALSNLEAIKTSKKENPELKIAIDFIKEKLEIEKKNIERNFENETKDNILEQEKRLNKENENVRLKIISNKENIEKQIRNTNNKILDEFKKVLKEDNKSRIEENKLEENKKHNEKISILEKERDAFINQKILQFKNEFKDIEKSYYDGKINIYYNMEYYSFIVRSFYKINNIIRYKNVFYSFV